MSGSHSAAVFGAGREPIAAELARFGASRSFEDLPPVTLERARMIVASTLASAALGFDISSARIIRALALERGGTPEASIWFGPKPRLPVAQIARVNAMASDAAASDDSDLRNIVHIGTAVSATALALGERTHASGRDVLAAMVLGYEVAGRIGAAITPGYSERGFHGCVIAIFGGTVAASRLLNLAPAKHAQALAIAASSIGGLSAAANSSVAREYHAGLSAMLGVEAALAADRGFAVDETIFEAPRGFFETFGGRDAVGETVTRGLGESWDITSHMAIKLVPGAHPYHAAAEAAALAAIQANVTPDEIGTITVAARLVGREPVYHPTDLVGMAHSLPYFVAAAVVDRTFGWDHATPTKIVDPIIAAVQDKVLVAEDNSAVARSCGGSVSITTRTGGTFASTVAAPRGSGARGIDWADVDAKYRRLVPNANVAQRQIETSLELIHHLDRVDDVNELTAALTAA